MTEFDNRKKAFENKYAHDEETAFKVRNRSNKLLGLWAAGLLGKTGESADAYAKEVVMADFEAPGDDDVIAKLLKDFVVAGVTMQERDIRLQLQQCLAEAQRQIQSGTA
jgi:hypothetical protein